jgi:hypothetical protein
MFGALFYHNWYDKQRSPSCDERDNYDHIVQIATNNLFRHEDYDMREGIIDINF